MDHILIENLEVFFRVGVPNAERAQPQRLLLCLTLHLDTRAAALSDDLSHTVDYHAVAQGLMGFGNGREWRLIETLASDIALWILASFPVRRVGVEVKKFVLPETSHVSVRIEREAPPAG